MRKTKIQLSRRQALKSGVAAAGAIAISAAPFHIVRAQDREKLGVAVVGAGGMGGYSVDESLQENLVALVDVDENTIASVMKDKVKDQAHPKIFYDYRKMLEQCHKEIDVVLIATPDHHHAPAAIRAIDLGKHVFAQKPLAHNIYECYALARAAKEKQVHTQMGNQGYCGETIRRVAEFIASGAIGEVTETHTVLGRNFGGNGGRSAAKPVPAGLHWDEWLGPAPAREFHDGLHPFNWRNWRAFGTGTIGDMACHHVAFPFMALRLWEAKQFSVECVKTASGSDEQYPQDNIVCYHVPAREGIAAVKCFVYDHAALKPEVMLETEKKERREFGEFTLFVGTKGMIGSDGRTIPKELEAGEIQRTLPRAHGGPIADLYHCIRHGGTPASNFVDAAASLTSIALTGHLAQFAGNGSKIDWDVDQMTCTNNPDVNRFVKREYRKGWEVV